MGIAGFDKLFRFIHRAVCVVCLCSVGDGGSKALGILVHHGGIGAVGYGGSDLICFLQVVGCIGSIRNIGIGLTCHGIDGGLLATINQLGFFFCCTAEVGSGLAISLAHCLLSLIRGLGGGIGAVIVGYFAYNGACRIGFYIQSLIRDLVLGGVADIFRGEATVAGDSGSLAAADGIGLTTGNGIDLAAVYGMLFFTGDRGFQAAFVGFCFLSGHSFRACTGDRFILVSTHCDAQVSFEIFGHFSGYGRFHFSANGSFQILANGVDHVFGSRVHQVLSRIGNHSVFSGILDIRSSLLGVGLVCSVSSVGIESVIAQVGGGGVLSIGCGTLDARFCLINNGFIGSILDSLQNLLQVLGDIGFLICISQTGNCRIRFNCSHGRYIPSGTIGCRIRSTFFS